MNSGSSSSSRASAITQALTAARQLSSLWKPRQAAKLLNQPPPAVFTGRAKEAVQESTRLLLLLHEGVKACHNAESAEQLLQALQEQHHFKRLEH
jgi:hypothetical protein